MTSSPVIVLDLGTFNSKIGLAGNTAPQYIARSVYATFEGQQFNGKHAIQICSTKPSKGAKEKPQFFEIERPCMASQNEFSRVPYTYTSVHANTAAAAAKTDTTDTTPAAADTTTTTAGAETADDDEQESDATLNARNCPLQQYFEELVFRKDKQLIGGNVNDNSNSNTDEMPAVLLSAELLSSKYQFSYQSEILYETFNVPGVYFEIAPVLGMYSTSRLNGLCVDMGHSQTSIVPIVDGYQIENASKKLTYMGGATVSKFFQTLLRKSGITLHTTLETEIVHQIKAEFCELHDEQYQIGTEEDQFEELRRYEKLPDGKPLPIGCSRFRAPEVLFCPELLGIQESGIDVAILNCVNSCNLQLRSKLMENMTLMGGTSKLNGFPQRLLNEISNKDFNKYDYNVIEYNADVNNIIKFKAKRSRFQIRARSDRENSAWIGGSILASMEQFQQLLITKAVYQEYGANAFFRNL